MHVVHLSYSQIVKAVEDGHDVRGITVWTLVDNFEWAYGWEKKFGLYGWQHGDPDNARVLHDTSKVSSGFAGCCTCMCSSPRVCRLVFLGCACPDTCTSVRA
jgi:Glycosyl hydrolase family 1